MHIGLYGLGYPGGYCVFLEFTYHKIEWSPSIGSVNTVNPKQSLNGTYVYPSLGEVGELEKRNEVSYMC
jgi:hypothetical protein